MKIKGKELSEETIVAACENYGISFEPTQESCLFEEGDVVIILYEHLVWEIRIIIKDYTGKGKLMSCDLDGVVVNRGQAGFEQDDYRKIGVLRDYIKYEP